MRQIINSFVYVTFGFWNLGFLTLVYVFWLPFIGWALLEATLNGEIESEFFFTFVGLIIVPTVCTFIGWKNFLVQPRKLLSLFYGVETPLFLICLIRLFVIRELNPLSLFLLATFCVAVSAFFLEFLTDNRQQNPLYNWWQLIAHSCVLITGIYVSLLTLFYALPVGNSVIRSIFSWQWKNIGWWVLHPAVILFGFIFFFSCLVFTLMPITLVILYSNSTWQVWQRFSRQYNKSISIAILLGILTLWFSLFIALDKQPQIKVFKLLNTPAKTIAERQAIIKQEKILRKGLLNAYLYPYRYLSARDESNKIKAMYQRNFNVSDTTASFIQDSFNFLISPFLYQGKSQDSEQAEKLYEELFDQSIQQGEQNAIQHALKSTAILDQAKAGLLNINERKVFLEKQAVNLEEQGNWAKVEIHEVYQNQTFEPEEIFYYFSLPESAVITGIWLGDTDNLATRFPFKVSTRGAAQKVYNSQVRRTRPVDPALLEQVGPKQYRLRAFPVPAKRRIGRNNNRPTKMHLWLTYRVMQKNGAWQLPHLQQKRNIFWTKRTKRFRQGKKVKFKQDEWLEKSLPAKLIQPQSYKINLLEDKYHIIAEPLQEKDYSLPQQQKLAVIVDTSYSMAEQQKDFVQNITWLQKNIAPHNDIDFYLTSAPGINPTRLNQANKYNPKTQTFFGTLQLPQMLEQFASLQAEKDYQGIIVITDAGSYELANNQNNLPAISAPLWLVHLGSLAFAYDDPTFKTIQATGGGVGTEIDKILRIHATQQNLGDSLVAVADGYAWYLEENNDKQKNGDSVHNFAPLAAKILVKGFTKTLVKDNLAQLDAIHAIAKTYKIVTPFSSMIVLVNDAQREALKKAEAAADRFKRTIENGKENLNKPNNPLNNKLPESVGVPEPSLIISLAGIGCILLLTRQGKKFS